MKIYAVTFRDGDRTLWFTGREYSDKVTDAKLYQNRGVAVRAMRGIDDPYEIIEIASAEVVLRSEKEDHR